MDTSPEWCGGLEDGESHAVREWLSEEAARTAVLFPPSATAKLEAKLAAALQGRGQAIAPIKHADRFYRFDAATDTWVTAPVLSDGDIGLWRSLRFGSIVSRTSLSSAIVSCPYPSVDQMRGTRAMVRIAGGTDATESIEYELEAEQEVSDGLRVPRSTHEVSWDGPDAVLVTHRDRQGDGTMVWAVDRLIRGAPWEEAVRVHTFPENRVAASMRRDSLIRPARYFSVEWPDHRSRVYHVLVGEDPQADRWRQIPVPHHVRVTLTGQWAVLIPTRAWTIGATTFAPSEILIAPLVDLLERADSVRRLWAGGPGERLVRVVFTRDLVVVTVERASTTRLISLDPVDGVERLLHVEDRSLSLRTTPVDVADPSYSDDVWVGVSGPTTPPTLARVRARDPSSFRVVRQGIAAFGHEQFTARTGVVTVDGHTVKYTLVAPRDLVRDESNAVVVSAYGGFNVPETLDYLDVTGPTWLDCQCAGGRKGVYVFVHVAPTQRETSSPWSRLSESTNQLLAVIDDLIRQGVTRPGLVGLTGVSHGSLLVMNAALARPSMFGAIVCRSGVFDLLRFPELDGRSWVTEYGDPTIPAQRKAMRSVSPLHRGIGPGKMPAALIWCAADDDRVSPVHSRTMVARLRALGGDVLYLESPHGGHDGLGSNLSGVHGHAVVGRFFCRHLTLPS